MGLDISCRQYWPCFIRTRRLVRARRLCRGSEPALLVSRLCHFALVVRDCFRNRVCCAVWRTDLAATWRLFFITDAGSDGAALLPLAIAEPLGGEDRLAVLTRATVLGVDLERDSNYYFLVAAIAMLICVLLWRFHRSPVGSVLVADGLKINSVRASSVIRQIGTS